ncbi:hypothetical protein Hanom_Chr04g00371321 [Helianthus anomalus]
MKSSVESSNVKPSSLSETAADTAAEVAADSCSSSVKNSTVFALNAIANFWNISEICGGFEEAAEPNSIWILFVWLIT